MMQVLSDVAWDSPYPIHTNCMHRLRTAQQLDTALAAEHVECTLKLSMQCDLDMHIVQCFLSSCTYQPAICVMLRDSKQMLEDDVLVECMSSYLDHQLVLFHMGYLYVLPHMV